MNYQKQPPREVLDIFKRANVDCGTFDYYAFPETFGSTAGPSGGIGGSAISTFTVEAYVCDGIGPTVYVCAGKFKFRKGDYKPSWC